MDIIVGIDVAVSRGRDTYNDSGQFRDSIDDGGVGMY